MMEDSRPYYGLPFQKDLVSTSWAPVLDPRSKLSTLFPNFSADFLLVQTRANGP